MNAFTKRIMTSRLELIPATVALVRVEMEGWLAWYLVLPGKRGEHPQSLSAMAASKDRQIRKELSRSATTCAPCTGDVATELKRCGVLWNTLSLPLA